MGESKPRILVLYYSQSGQLREIIESVFETVKDGVEIVWHRIEPAEEYPFPWPTMRFFDTMPETVARQSIPLKPLPGHIREGAYDLVVFGHQPWFLHPSLPIQSFLQSPDAEVLRGKRVVTVIGARNMWLHAQEVVKEHLARLGATLVGNIALVDRNPNLVSTLTIIRWAFGGKKEATRWLPAAGVQNDDVLRASRFGPLVQRAARNERDYNLQETLSGAGAAPVAPGLIVLERRGLKAFRKWSPYIRERGGPGAPARQGRVRLFKNLLIVAIFILGPLANLTAWIQRVSQQRRLREEAVYFRGVAFKPGQL